MNNIQIDKEFQNLIPTVLGYAAGVNANTKPEEEKAS